MDRPVIAKLKYLRIAPRKVRLAASSLKNLPVQEAEAYLRLSPTRAAVPILKLLHSAISNAEKNFKLPTDKLFIKEIRVDQGPKSKRWIPRARGSSNTIERKTSHLTLTLAVSDKITPRFTFMVKPKKQKGASKKKKEKAKTEGKEKEPISKFQPKPAKGFFKKFFRRKVI
ncbi:50S ribosomal protein L22 [Candidatus Jorgensenbacteria bacterium CG_4_8_14_3_um_filter_38_10]|uniref:Large ribosomal subunit protein uL22 n=1 Tax=Candidatus Jorgensenbacteria bacterium CG11_big_fil_rev_8_21_14_0_20_38_23 TaxID=1974594 RepID=A0A2H0NFB9_9BACT|nr:MAG: 50S ribosomal protein L22 [Candidatus Jorgensenbacteria bacterium CG11_big_fil_rev_8_21_14_0_20_38_23]PIV13203.1 MAG: 50S ribosomal protein L22 [Candidatus Jorgensenbacteria bacterium CG03_land_8_20_14_0_80_38_39]PIW97698.1 MAG: 50S ribosomal protein L22 [Candidatus Jorgensenbacteria bacterium CG_4_8_14_3_um_filter_38_10]PJA94939.1 MAG: 50S ribosomal protein L22 [Candidatus Jorgensenbacteria bacterium CG_4_9_14_3_um_filter_38_10]